LLSETGTMWVDRFYRIKDSPLVSVTGSTAMGRKVATTVAGRLGQSLLELVGNNVIIISENADFEMALQAALFGTVGTTGQRCTSTRRLIVHESIKDQFIKSLIHAYQQISIGNTLDDGVLMGPLIVTVQLLMRWNKLWIIVFGKATGCFVVEKGLLSRALKAGNM
jgi:aldehyde dehydrogenase (NAD+)